MTSTKAATKVKEVTVLSRLVIKADPRKVVYTCLSSNGKDKYETTLFNGKATHCQCKSTVICYHKTGCEAREAARNDAEANRRAAMDIQFNPWFA